MELRKTKGVWGSKGINVSGVVFVVELRLMVVTRCIGNSRGIDIIMIVHVKYVLLLSSMYASKWQVASSLKEVESISAFILFVHTLCNKNFCSAATLMLGFEYFLH